MKLKKYLPIIGIAIFAYLLYKINLSSVLAEISNANFFYLGVASAFIILSWFTSTYKWYVIARRQKTKIPFLEAFKINLMSGFYGFVTPSRIGALIRVEYLKKFNEDKLGKGISNYVLEKIFDIGSLLLLVGISSFFFKEIISANYLNYALVGFAIFLIFIIILRDENNTKWLLRFFYAKFVPAKIKNGMRDGFYSFYEDMPERRLFIIFFLCNIINWVVLYSIFYFIGLSVGINVSFFYFLLFMPIVTLVGQIPITINGLGTREAVMISLFGLLGIEAAKIFSMSLINLLINGIVPAVIGALLSFKEKNNS
ncbi:MAG: lysylphosphatidylglycerol synthase transmembrane domain-containing protein [Nanoarchaeota archaeon]